MNVLFGDFETFSTLDLRAVGGYRYTPECEPILFANTVNDEPVECWDIVTSPARPNPLLAEIDPLSIGRFVAHNCNFDRNVWENWGARPFDLPDRCEWFCTQAQAQSHGFPGSLDGLCQTFNLPHDKSKIADGKRLINKFCKPAPKNHKARRYGPDNAPDDWLRFVQYAMNDVAAMRELHQNHLPAWNYPDRDADIYALDQRINDRGFAVDLELIRAVDRSAGEAKARLFAEFKALSGLTTNPTQRPAFLAYLQDAYRVNLPNTQAATLTAALRQGELPDGARRLIEVFIAATKSSVAKFTKLESATSADGRFRGGLQYCGAARTRRWSGRTFQPQNLPSIGLPPTEDVDAFILAAKEGFDDLVVDDTMTFASAALRGALVAPDGRKLAFADLSNIEGRVNAWLAGERWKLDAFAAFDRGEGPDLYKVTAAGLLAKTPDGVTGSERQIMGKIPELALGYQGGVGAVQTFAGKFGIKIVDYWHLIEQGLDAEVIARAEWNWDTWGEERHNEDVRKYGDEKYIGREEWLASEAIKLAWRDRHRQIDRLWGDCNENAKAAIEKPGAVFGAGQFLRFQTRTHKGRRYLIMRLPSGQLCAYFEPEISKTGDVTCFAVDPLTKQWARRKLYGGLFVENACQSIARDVMAHAMPIAEAAGFDIVLTVHDEIVSECDPDKRVEDLAAIMATNPPWAVGLPLAAAGAEAQRWGKE